MAETSSSAVPWKVLCAILLLWIVGCENGFLIQQTGSLVKGKISKVKTTTTETLVPPLSASLSVSNRTSSYDVCSYIQKQQISTLGSWWTQETNHFRESLLHSPANVPFGTRSAELQGLIDAVFSALPVTRLRRSIRSNSVSAEFHAARVARVLTVLQERYHNTSAPRLEVLVFGGSPTAGSNCERNNRLKKQSQCAWPGHLEAFVNARLGFDAIHVVNYAMGASSSEIAAMVCRFRLFPTATTPDVIINAYAVNDYSYHTESNTFRRMFESFVDAAQGVSTCNHDGPLLLYLDDFVVNYQKGGLLEQSEAYNAEISTMTAWHHVMTIAYSDVVRDLVYAGRPEEQLLVDWKHDMKHMTWSGHIAIVLSFAFNAMNTVLDFCDDDANKRQYSNSPATPYPLLDSGLRPHLDQAVSIQNVQETWTNRQKSWDCKNAEKETCAFAWVAMRKEAEMAHMAELSDIIVQQNGWEYVTKWPPTNYGLYGSIIDGHILLKVQDQHVNTVSFYYMKSYSAKWKDSMVEASVFLGNGTSGTPVASLQLSGFHEKKTSEYFTAKMNFEHAEGDTVTLRLILKAGKTFKISGLAFCTELL